METLETAVIDICASPGYTYAEYQRILDILQFATTHINIESVLPDATGDVNPAIDPEVSINPDAHSSRPIKLPSVSVHTLSCLAAPSGLQPVPCTMRPDTPMLQPAVNARRKREHKRKHGHSHIEKPRLKHIRAIRKKNHHISAELALLDYLILELDNLKETANFAIAQLNDRRCQTH